MTFGIRWKSFLSVWLVRHFCAYIWKGLLIRFAAVYDLLYVQFSGNFEWQLTHKNYLSNCFKKTKHSSTHGRETEMIYKF